MRECRRTTRGRRDWGLGTRKIAYYTDWQNGLAATAFAVFTLSMRTFSRLTGIMAAAGIASCGGAAPPPPPTPTPIRAVAMDEIRSDMAVFASDSFGGRESGTPYIRKAASFLANRLVSLGLEPAGDS